MKLFCIEMQHEDKKININIDTNKVKSWFIYKDHFIFIRYKDRTIDVVYLNDIIDHSKIESIILFFKMILRNQQREWDINLKETQALEYITNKKTYYRVKNLTGAFTRQ
jgi:hypothetical protein